jgi:serine/threonine protein kinase
VIDRWRRIEDICHDALERLPDERAACVREACAGDESLRIEVESLLANQSRAAALGSGLRIGDSEFGMSTEKLIGTQIGGIYGFEESDDAPALVLELIEGVTLGERVAESPMPLTEALGIPKQIAAALDAAHERGIVHRDLKAACCSSC